jgi:hypothetical protein
MIYEQYQRAQSNIEAEAIARYDFFKDFGDSFMDDNSGFSPSVAFNGVEMPRCPLCDQCFSPVIQDYGDLIRLIGYARHCECALPVTGNIAEDLRRSFFNSGKPFEPDAWEEYASQMSSTFPQVRALQEETKRRQAEAQRFAEGLKAPPALGVVGAAPFGPIHRVHIDGCESTTGHEIDPRGINHPSHYNQHPSGVECIAIVEHMSFNLGNAIKYAWRHSLKAGEDALKDLDKAIWYIKREKDLIREKLAPSDLDSDFDSDDD